MNIYVLYCSLLREVTKMKSLTSRIMTLHDELADLKAEFDSCRGDPPDAIL